jgi:dTDP-3-amino-3,4,6-trideoxy-alpha-D-glucose transaminase
LRHLDRHNLQRHKLAGEYTSRLANCVVTPVEREGSLHAYHLYVIRTSGRDALRAFLAERGIGTGIHYPVPVHRQPAYLHLSRGNRPLPVTEQVAGEIVSLPLYPQMELSQVERVSEAIKAFVDAGK